MCGENVAETRIVLYGKWRSGRAELTYEAIDYFSIEIRASSNINMQWFSEWERKGRVFDILKENLRRGEEGREGGFCVKLSIQKAVSSTLPVDASLNFSLI